MADNSVTIALKLDTTQFSNSMAQVKKELSGMGIGKEVAATRTGRSGTSSLEKEFSSMRSTISKMTSTMMGNLSAGNISGIVSAVMTAIINPAFLAVLPLIAAGVAALVVTMEALVFAFKPIQIILSAIGKILGATLIPISMVIVQALMPLITILTPFIRLMNLIFAPVKKILTNYLKANSEQLASGGVGAFNVFWTGTLLAAGSMMIVFGAELLKALLSALEAVALSLDKSLRELFHQSDSEISEGANNIKKLFGGITGAIDSFVNNLVAESEQMVQASASVSNATSTWQQNMKRQAINTPSDWQNLMTSGLTAVAEGRRTVQGISAEDARKILTEWAASGAGASTTIQFNVEGNVDDKTARYITDTVQRQLATMWRSSA